MEIRVLVAALLMLAAQPASKPVAMVLDARGRVEVTPVGEAPRLIAVGELLYPADRLSVPADGSLTLAILGAGAKETIKPGSSAAVDPKGCAPPEAVSTRSAQRPAVAGVMKGVRPSTPARRVWRSEGPTTSPRLRQPSLPCMTRLWPRTDRSWPGSPSGERGATACGCSRAPGENCGRPTREPRLAFPEGKEALQRGYVYAWEVADSTGKPIARSTFSVATVSEAKRLAELAPLATGGDRADLLAAAIAYANLGAYGEATAAYEKLAKLAPNEPAYREALAALYARAGRPEDARAMTAPPGKGRE